MVKRDTITDIKDSVGNILGVNKEESLLDYIEDEIDTQLDVDVSIIHCNEFSLLIAHSNTKSELPAHSTYAYRYRALSSSLVFKSYRCKMYIM